MSTAFAVAQPVTSRAQDSNIKIDEIVVTGTRLATMKAIAVKRDALNILDALSADDIGKLPDHNTAAALRRIPGVSVQEDQAEPRFPVLRGLNSTYNRTTINGAVVASVDSSSRTVPLDIVPSTLAATLEVVKTVTPDMDANAIGGVINIVTRSAFDYDEPFFFGNLSAAKYEQDGDVRGSELPWRGNFTAGTTFGPDDQFGVVASLNYQKRDSDIPQVETANPSWREYTAAGVPVNMGDPAGNGILVPIQRRLFWYNNIRERLGGNLELEWRSSSDFKAKVTGQYNEIKDDEERSENRFEQVGNVSNQGPTSGTFAQGRNIIGLGRFEIDRSIWGLTASTDWQATDAVRWTADFVYSGAKLDNPESTEEFRTNNNFGFYYDVSTFYPHFNAFDPAGLASPTNYGLTSHTELQRNSNEDVYEGRTDVTVALDNFADKAEVKVGGVYRSTQRDFDQDFTSFSPTAGLNYTLAQAYQRGPTPNIQGGYRLDPRVDSQAALDFFAANRALFNASVSNTTSDFVVDEDVTAAYGQFLVKTGDMTVIGGMRFEHTSINSNAIRVVNGVQTPQTVKGSYDNFLPGLQLRYDAADDLVIRGAITNTIGRPNFSDITARESINLTSSTPTVSRGNPDLKPRKSLGLDASIEYYIPDGLFAVGAFYKDIKNEIFSLTTTETLDLGLGRGAEAVTITQPRNAESAHILGFEVNYQQALTFLPSPLDGFGVSANVTLLDTTFNVVTPVGVRNPGFFLQPDTTANASIYYQSGGFEGKVSYNYISSFLETINGTIPSADQYWDKRGVWDAQVSYRINDNFTVYVEGENLSNSGRTELTGPNRDLLQENAVYGRVFWAGISTRF